MARHAAARLACALLAGAAALCALRPAAALDDSWVDGRASFFDTNNAGSCGFGAAGDSYAAYPDALPDYAGSCGVCLEVACRNADLTDGFGAPLQRGSACYDPSKTTVVKITDTCPCNSNQQWCCGDMRHLDLGRKVFAQLAAEVNGIIGIRYRRVDCSRLGAAGGAPGPAAPLPQAASVPAAPMTPPQALPASAQPVPVQAGEQTPAASSPLPSAQPQQPGSGSWPAASSPGPGGPPQPGGNPQPGRAGPSGGQQQNAPIDVASLLSQLQAPSKAPAPAAGPVRPAAGGEEWGGSPWQPPAPGGSNGDEAAAAAAAWAHAARGGGAAAPKQGGGGFDWQQGGAAQKPGGMPLASSNGASGAPPGGGSGGAQQAAAVLQGVGSLVGSLGGKQ